MSEDLKDLKMAVILITGFLLVAMIIAGSTAWNDIRNIEAAKQGIFYKDGKWSKE